MSVRRCQSEVDSIEFTRWAAHLQLSAAETEQARARADMDRQMRA